MYNLSDLSSIKSSYLMQYQNGFMLTDFQLVGEDLLVSSRDGIVSFMQKSSTG